MRKSFKPGDLFYTESPVRRGVFHLTLIMTRSEEYNGYFKCLIWNRKTFYETPIHKNDLYCLDEIINNKNCVISSI